jgi:hypothetical protein
MKPTEPQTRRADIPVRLRSHVKTTPSPQIVVKNVRKETANDNLPQLARSKLHPSPIIKKMLTYIRAGTGTPLLLTFKYG